MKPVVSLHSQSWERADTAEVFGTVDEMGCGPSFQGLGIRATSSGYDRAQHICSLTRSLGSLEPLNAAP